MSYLVVEELIDQPEIQEQKDFDFDFEDMTFAPVDPNMVDRDALDPGTEEDWADEYGL